MIAEVKPLIACVVMVTSIIFGGGTSCGSSSSRDRASANEADVAGPDRALTIDANAGVRSDGGGGEQVVDANDVSRLNIDLERLEAAISVAGGDPVMSWFSGDNEDSLVVVAVHGNVPASELRMAAQSVTPYAGRVRFVQSKYSTAQLEGFVKEAQHVWESYGVDWGGPRGRWVLNTLLKPGRYATLDAQPVVWVLVEPEREAELTAALRKVVPADALVIDSDAASVDYDR